MKTLSKSKLKENMFEIFREIELSGEELVVTEHGKPVLRISSIEKKRTVEEIFGPQQGKAVFHEDPNTQQ